MVCQTSPVELYSSIRFVGDADGIRAVAADGIEVVPVEIEVVPEADVDFSGPYKALKDLIRTSRSDTLEQTEKLIGFSAAEEPVADADLL